MSDMVIANAALRDKPGRWDIHIKDGRFASVDKAGEAAPVPGTAFIDAQGHLACEPFIDPHVHLDATLTAGDPRWNMGGTLFEGIEIWSERKKTVSLEDVKERARRAIGWHIANGVQAIRTHVDTTDPGLVALKALLELREELREDIDLQIVAFPQEGIESFPHGFELLEEAVRLGADVVGAIPHFEFTREYGVSSLDKALDLAQKYGTLVDVHCDEIDDEQSRFVEVLAEGALRRGLGPRVTASHTTAMGSYNDAYAYKLFRLLRLSGINFVSNPLVNTHLQGRFDSYPKRRGVTRVKELLADGINVCFGHDDIADPWYPMGTANMLQVLFLGLHVTQLMGYDQIRQGLDLITTNSARTMNLLDSYGIEVGKPGNLVILNAPDGYEAVRQMATVLYSIRGGRVLAQATAPVSTISLASAGGSPEPVDFTL